MSESDRFSDEENIEYSVTHDPESDSSDLNDADNSNKDQDEDEPQIDRLATLTSTLRTTDTHTNQILRAHIGILVSALGGPDHTSDKGLYKLGHDALACLKDLKRWIKTVDEKNNTSDVALACADCGLLQNDLTVILCQWDRPPAGVVRSRTTDKIMIACLELLVLLTWPTELNSKTAPEEYSAKARLRLAQLRYKHHILVYRGGRTLKAVIRLGLEALTIPEEDREPRDLSILRLIVYFIRNVLYIEPLPATNGKKAVSNSLRYPGGINPSDLSMQAVIPAFEKNNVFMFLISIAHSVLTNIRDEQFGLLVMESLYLITRELDTDYLIHKPALEEPQNDAANVVPPASAAVGMDLTALLSEEDKRRKKLQSAMSTRHGRFGTLISLKNSANASYLAVSGQKALPSTYDTLKKLDSTKKWHKSSTFRYDSNAFVRDATTTIRGKSLASFLSFIDRLLSSGSFNNLLLFVSRHLTNLANDEIGRAGILNAIDSHDLAAYFLTVSWFFRFKRRKALILSESDLAPAGDGLTYGSVGAALSEVNFILLVSYMRSSFESRDFHSLHVAMVCFREMLLISNTIFAKERTQQEIELLTEEDINEDREMAEGIIRKLFSQKEFLDLCVNIPKSADKHSPEYLKVTISVVHTLLRSFEILSNEDVHLFIKTRRRMRKLKNGNGLNQQMDREHWHLIDRGSDEEDDEEEIKFITRERKLDYKNSEIRFFHPAIVSTHIKYLSRYEDMTHDEIKKGISFFHRLFVVRKDYLALYRLDFMVLLNELQSYLPRSSGIRRHVDEFVVYFMKKFQEALLSFPLAIELLFPRFENLEYMSYLSTGDLRVYDKNTESSQFSRKTNSYFDSDAVQPRAALFFQFVENDKSLDEKIGALTYHLSKKKNTTKLLNLFVEEFARIAHSAKQGIKDELTLRLSLANRRLVVSEQLIRLLLQTVGFTLPFLQNDETKFRSNSDTNILLEASELLKKWLEQHLRGVGDIELFLDQFQRVIFPREHLEFGKLALEKQRSGEALEMDGGLAKEIGPEIVDILIGLARRREYDEEVASRFYPEDIDSPLSDDSETEANSEPASQKSRRRVRTSSDELLDGLDSDDDVYRSKRKSGVRRKKATDRDVSDSEPVRSFISAEFVADSDDESDSEEHRQFFARESKLRELIALRGGVANKEDLQEFQRSWSNLLSKLTTQEVRKAVSSASRLFVADSDDEEGVDDYKSEVIHIVTMEVSNGENSANDSGDLKRSIEEEIQAPRKRRVIIDDEDE